MMKTKVFGLAALLAAAASPLALSSAAYANTPEAAGASAGSGKVMTNQDWWPERLDLRPLRQHAAESNPMGDDFKYAEEFAKLDLNAVKADISALMTTSLSMDTQFYELKRHPVLRGVAL